MQQFPNQVILPQIKKKDSQINRPQTNENYHFSDPKLNPRKEQKKDNYAAEALMSIQTVSNFSKLFFSKANIDEIQKIIRYTVYIESDKQYVLGEQDQRELLIVMRAVYLEYSRVPSEISQYKQELAKLNELVLERVMPNLLSNITQYLAYIKDSQDPVRILDRPQNVSQAGLKRSRDIMEARTGMTPTEYNNKFFNDYTQ